MYVQKYYCDHCGKELDNMEDYINTTIETGYAYMEKDLCENCCKDLWEIIVKFCSVQKDRNLND